MSLLPLSKCLDPADFEQLAKPLAEVDRVGIPGQHPMRRWEYAMALEAVMRLQATSERRLVHAVDVGGAGSPFPAILADHLGWSVDMVDPHALVRPQDLSQYLHSGPTLKDVVTCLSVLEHVDDLSRFVYHLNCLTAPSGLLFLTVDYTDGSPGQSPADDHYHFHWMRKRIFNQRVLVEQVVDRLLDYDFTFFGGRGRGDFFEWHGAHVYDYSFASLALVKRA